MTDLHEPSKPKDVSSVPGNEKDSTTRARAPGRTGRSWAPGQLASQRRCHRCLHCLRCRRCCLRCRRCRRCCRLAVLQEGEEEGGGRPWKWESPAAARGSDGTVLVVVAVAAAAAVAVAFAVPGFGRCSLRRHRSLVGEWGEEEGELMKEVGGGVMDRQDVSMSSLDRWTHRCRRANQDV